MLVITAKQLASLKSSIHSGLDKQSYLLNKFKIHLNEDDADIDVDNCFVTTEEEISEWIDEQEGSSDFTQAQKAGLRASYIESYSELYPDVGAKYIVTSELSSGQENVFALSLQVNQGQLGMGLMQFYGLFASRDDAQSTAKALSGIVFI